MLQEKEKLKLPLPCSSRAPQVCMDALTRPRRNGEREGLTRESLLRSSKRISEPHCSVPTRGVAGPEPGRAPSKINISETLIL